MAFNERGITGGERIPISLEFAKKDQQAYRLELSSFSASFPVNPPPMYDGNAVMDVAYNLRSVEQTVQQFYRLHITTPDRSATDTIYVSEAEYQAYALDTKTKLSARVLLRMISDFDEHLLLERSGNKTELLEAAQRHTVSSNNDDDDYIDANDVNLPGNTDPEDLSTDARVYQGRQYYEGSYYSQSPSQRIFGDSTDQGLLTDWEKTKYLRQMLYSSNLMERYDAGNIIAATNIRLVKEFADKYYADGVEKADMLQDGNEGLIIGIYKFDPSLGNRLSTYVTWWIRQSIGRGIHDTGRTIRLPVHLNESLNQIKRTLHSLNKNLDQPMEMYDYSTQVLIAEELGIPVLRIQRIILAFKSTDMISLDEPVNDEEESASMLTFIDSGESTDGEAHANLNRSEVLDYIANFFATVRRVVNPKNGNSIQVTDKDRERATRLFAMRWGTGNDDGMTLEQIAISEGITRERVRQILEPYHHTLKAELIKQGYFTPEKGEKYTDEVPVKPPKPRKGAKKGKEHAVGESE